MAPRSNVPIRIGGSKVRTGCTTCKQRHVKCDEARPICLKCRKVGRQCTYDQPLPGTQQQAPCLLREAQTSLSVVPSRHSGPGASGISKSLSPYGSCGVVEVGAVKNFAAYLGKDLAGCFSNDLWCRILPRMAQHEPSVWHGISAVSALDTSIRLRCFRQEGHPDMNIAIRQYSKAIQALNLRLTSGEVAHRRDFVLVTCILFAIFECLRHHYQSALKHISSGMKLLTEWTEEARSRNQSSAGSYFDYAALRPAFLSLDSQAVQMGDKSFQEYLALSAINTQLHIPQVFTTVEQAHYMLIYIFNRISHWAELKDHSAADRYQKTDNWVQDERRVPQMQLLQWDTAFNKHLALQPQPATLLLLIQRKVIEIFFNKESDGRSEMEWDKYLPSFGEAVEYVEEYARLTAVNNPTSVTDDNDQGQPRLKMTAVLTLAMDIVLPLFLISTKCRDSQIRRRALAILKTCNRKEGIWDSNSCAELAEKLVILEESEAMEDGFVPESARIHVLDVRSNEEGGGKITPQKLVTDEDGVTLIELSGDPIVLPTPPEQEPYMERVDIQ